MISPPSRPPALPEHPPALRRPSRGTSGALGRVACTPLRSVPSASFTAPPRDPQAAPRVARTDRCALRPLVGLSAGRVPPRFVHRAASERAAAKARSQRVGRVEDGPCRARSRMDRAAPRQGPTNLDLVAHAVGRGGHPRRPAAAAARHGANRQRHHSLALASMPGPPFQCPADFHELSRRHPLQLRGRGDARIPLVAHALRPLTPRPALGAASPSQAVRSNRPGRAL